LQGPDPLRFRAETCTVVRSRGGSHLLGAALDRREDVWVAVPDLAPEHVAPDEPRPQELEGLLRQVACGGDPAWPRVTPSREGGHVEHMMHGMSGHCLTKKWNDMKWLNMKL